MLRWAPLAPHVFVMLSLLAGCSDSANSSPASQDTVDSVAELVTLRPLSVSEDLRIVDDLDREVLL